MFILDMIRRLWEEVERDAEPPVDLDPITPSFDVQGWCTRERVVRVPSRPGWFYRRLKTSDGLPDGIVAHYTATPPGTAMAMAVRRRDHDRSRFRRPNGAMPGSWHFTIAQDGVIIQQLSIKQGGFHAGSKTARRTPVGWANHTTIGIELEGFGDIFPTPQVESACWLWRELIQHCDIKREHAMLQHSWIDPTRRKDPGEVWMQKHATRVLDYSYKEQP